jgi:hypothetical protein
MSYAAIAQDKILVVRHKNLRDHLAHRYAGLHASAPVLLAASIIVIASCIAASVLLPAAVGPLLAAMVILMIGAVGLTFLSVYASGEMLEAQFDQSRRVARLVYRGAFAHTEWVIPFGKIANARMAMGYDARGNKLAEPLLELTNGRNITLPPSTSWSDIEAIRDLIATEAVDKTAEAWARKTSAYPEAYARLRRSKGS